ncbi:MAG TPA: hypothetical protein ENJ19_11620, partial [Gammaproteobacteria bacterium]|nr:hypothetical protein [Gammaproteobacteria bacterium]
MALQLAKLTRPAAGSALARERLFDQLDAARSTSLIWINAPAGAGKTTLISSYIEARKCKTLWYRMDAGDRDAASFFHYLGKALQVAAGGRRKMPVLSPEYRQGLLQFSRHYFRELFQHLGESALLVLDNLQDAGTNAEVCELLAVACEEVPAGSCIVVASRVEMPTVFARLRVARKVTEIHWQDLQFNLDEQLAIARQRYPQHDITPQHIQGLDRHVRGWVTGLVLLLEQGTHCHDLKFEAEEVDRQYLFDYFASEIFAAIDAHTQTFLIQTAVLPTMTAAICRRLTGNRSAGKILADLARKQYFTVRRGSIKPGYEYHPLFRQFLLQQASEQLDDAAYRQLQSQAGLLLADDGGIDEAAKLFIDAQNWQALCALVLKHARQQIETGRNQQLVQWIEQLPEDVAQQPWLTYWLGMACLRYQNHRARTLFESAYARFKKAKDAKGLYLSWCGVSDAYRFAHDHFVGADRWIDELAWLQQNHTRPFDLDLRGHLVFSATGLLLWARPSHPDLPQWITRLEALYRRVSGTTLKAMCAGQLVIHYSHIGEMEKLREMDRRLRKLEEKRDNTALAATVIMALKCAIDWLTGELKMSDTLIDEHQRFIRDRGVDVYSGLSLSQSLYHATCRRDPERVESLLEDYLDDVADDDILAQCYFQLHSCNLQILRRNYDLALTHGDLALELADKSAVPFAQWFASALVAYLLVEKGEYRQAGHYLGVVRGIVEPMRSLSGVAVADMLQSYLAYCQNEMDTALQFLETGFRRAREKDIKASGVWPPRMIATLCALALEHDIEPDYARRLIRIYTYLPQDCRHVSEHWPWPLKIYTLGRFGVLLDDEPLDVETRPFDLLKVVLANGGRNVHEQTI